MTRKFRRVAGVAILLAGIAASIPSIADTPRHVTGQSNAQNNGHNAIKGSDHGRPRMENHREAHGGRHGGWGINLGVGVALGTALAMPYYSPFYAPNYYGPPSYPPYYPQPIVLQQPPVYIEQAQYEPQQNPAPQTGYWYHCDSPDGYYPYIKECPNGWQQVSPTPTPLR